MDLERFNTVAAVLHEHLIRDVLELLQQFIQEPQICGLRVTEHGRRLVLVLCEEVGPGGSRSWAWKTSMRNVSEQLSCRAGRWLLAGPMLFQSPRGLVTSSSQADGQHLIVFNALTSQWFVSRIALNFYVYRWLGLVEGFIYYHVRKRYVKRRMSWDIPMDDMKEIVLTVHNHDDAAPAWLKRYDRVTHSAAIGTCIYLYRVDEGMSAFDTLTHRWLAMSQPAGINHLHRRASLVAMDNTLYFLSMEGCARYHSETDQWTPLAPNPNMGVDESNAIATVDGLVYIDADNHLCRYSVTEDRHEKLKLGQHRIQMSGLCRSLCALDLST